MPHTATLQILLILSVHAVGLDAVCLSYHACYYDQLLDWSNISRFDSSHEERSAITCAIACLQHNPDTHLVMAKLVNVNQLLSCGCGSELALGNRSGIAHDYYNCYVCPDVENQKCGSDKTSSIYFIHHTDDPCSRLEFDMPATVTTIATTTTLSTNNPTHSNVTVTHNFSPSSALNNITYPDTPPLKFLGCYDEVKVNESLVVTLYLEGDDVGVISCYNNCSRYNPTADIILVKLLKAGRVYCGCGERVALAAETADVDCDLYCHNDLKQQCGGWNTVSAYTGSGSWGSHISLVLLFTALLSQLL